MQPHIIRIQPATTARIPRSLLCRATVQSTKDFKFHRGVSIEIDKIPSMGKLRNKHQQQQKKVQATEQIDL